mmetsp:Transcript_26602/g.66691  ORF Transcript_26602/g.66691 Transcript_26602/m.66691 type:complete len:233 (-) Transcript_26602:166-864(-)|eukprot:CAMPEP_0174900540 /NCGR_PEP_ID=MMETSP0167-20121228/31672_1 /TAXON_ID=38298 /ORGANISM="Rhodella maculata, Strain CCMP736" /LENGTH=232 /DNA_ID=CAMNT_0016141951 /DNA_START=131 /DNA_END=829 /DNA_ORIENTATION=+
MTFKQVASYDIDEVCIWLNCIGLGGKADAFRQNAVDGATLVSLTPEDLRGDLNLTSLQAKKFEQSLATTLSMASNGGLPGPGGAYSYGGPDLGPRVQELETENANLRYELSLLKQHPPAPVAPNYSVPVGPPGQAPPVHGGYPPEQYGGYPPQHHGGYPPQQRGGYPPQQRGQRSRPGVVGGAATGAAGGAVKGAIMGAILPGMSAGDGAKAGAAVGGFGGGMKGLKNRYRR